MAEKRKYADRAQANILAVAKRRRRVREMAIELMGGKCQVCANCHREAHAGVLQLPRETEVEKRGKLREALAGND